MIELLLELLFQFFGEFLLQLLLEVIAEVGLRPLAAPFSRQAAPWLKSIGYLLLGLGVGGLSLWPAPRHFIQTPWLRMANVFLTPLAVGGCMALLGAWRSHRAQTLLGIDRFACGFLFAIGVAAVRYFGTA